MEVSFFYVSFDVLDNDLLLVFLGGKDWVERYYVSFIGREVDQLNFGVVEFYDLFKFFFFLQSYVFSMEGCQVGFLG